jgi:class 3 adenylate cyclase
MEIRPGGEPVTGGTPLVGRQDELRRLGQALQHAGRGGAGLALITGDAGIGKTRIVLELAARARADGWSVLAGRCFDGDEAPPFWPWTQVLRAAARQHSLERLRRLAGPAASVLAAVLPELADEARPPRPADDDPSRFRLFDAVTALLRALSASRPLLVVVDDLHWADPASLALLAFLGRHLDGSPVAVMACRRPADGIHLHPAHGQVQSTATCTVELGGLPREDSARFVQLTAGVRPDPALLDDLWSRTEGNPFFLGELVRLLSAEQQLASGGQLVLGSVALPEGVRDVLSRRLQLVSPECADLLRAGAVLGREISVEVLRHVTGLAPSSLHTYLEEAARARLVAALPGGSLRYRFAHALVQEFLYDDLAPARRAELHDRTGRALLEVHASALDAHVAELAHHFVRAGELGSPAEALRWSVRAGHAAAAASAHEEAAAHFARALRVLESSPVSPRPDEERGAVLLALGEAQCRAGDTDAGRASFSCAADDGLVRGDAELLAHAALGYGVGLGGYGFVARADGVLLSLLEEALVNLGERDTVLRVRVLARLATELYFTPFRSRRLQVSEQAVAMARRLGNPHAELVAVYSRTAALLGPDGLEEQREAAARTLSLAQVLGDQDMQFRAHALRLTVALGIGDADQVQAEVQACRELADELSRPLHAWHAAVFAAMIELQAGRLEQARERADEALQAGLRGHRDMALVMYGAQQLVLHWAKGRLPVVLDSVRYYADHFPHAPAWRAALAFCLADTDRPDAARRELETLAARDFTDLPRDANFLTAVTLLALTAARLGDRERAAQLERLLAPYADRQVVLAGGAVGYFSVSYPLGMLAAARDDLDEALSRLTRAQEHHERRGARLHLVETAVEQVRLLLRRGATGDAPAARALLSQALPLAREIGMPVAVSRLESLAALLSGLAPCAPGRSSVPPEERADQGEAVTILLTDVAGSTALTERLGERAVHAMLLEHRQLVSAAAGLYGGLALKSLGDGALCVFPDAAGALRCAAWLQAQAEDRLGLPGLRLRIGVHTGPVLRDGESMYGRSMILAHRVADRAGPGEVLVSAAAHAAADAPELGFERAEAMELKGFDAPQVVHRLACGRA